MQDALLRIHQQLIPVQKPNGLIWRFTLDRILAESVLANINVPACDNSAMDGYALRAVMHKLKALCLSNGQSLAGTPRFAGRGVQTALGEMQAVRIMTGAMIPAGADAVVMQRKCYAYYANTAEQTCGARRQYSSCGR